MAKKLHVNLSKVIVYNCCPAVSSLGGISRRGMNPPPTPHTRSPLPNEMSPLCRRTYAYMRMFCFWQMSAGRLLIWLFWILLAAGRRVFEMPTLSPRICCPEWLNYSKVSCIWLVKRKNEYHLHLPWPYGWTPESPSKVTVNEVYAKWFKLLNRCERTFSSFQRFL